MAVRALLSAEHISHVYRTPGGDVPALDDVTLRLSGESFVCLVGPSGCGKSTLLRILAGLLRPTEGRVLLDGQPLTRAQRRVGIVFQKANLMPWRTVAGNLALPLELAGTPPAERAERTRAMLELTGLEGFAGAYPGALSGGMAQRVAIGRALIHDPQVLLLDEPFGALDALTREQMSEELLRIWARHRKTVLMVTHSIPEAVLLADRVLVMGPRPGHLVAEVPIPLARPRSLALLHQPDFVALSEQVRRSIRPA
ncbi:MAG: ABC transporter ATP-binding protein [Anaerolineae bacterium]|nr:ABC transporter ATP-binding protein [Anaerolineae bacterium]MEB2287748.1 ABC transporter ATP-binding protein [Anaerolineae bacterium]